LIPSPPTFNYFPICATQTQETTLGQSTGTTCGYNPVFAGSRGNWTGNAPTTCLGISACTETVGGVTYVTMPYVFFSVTASPVAVMTAQIVNCPVPFNPATCTQSKDSTTLALSHSVMWINTNAFVGYGPTATLELAQIGTSDANTLDPSKYPGQYVLITDQYGNADLVFFGTTFSACTGPGCPQ
jgi:hypothetical protein